ncbi:MAG: phage tail sheath family protein, partial [Burkholderiales bacterium]
MATVMKTPGVYIVETDAFPNSVVQVATAVPAFVGYTERADNIDTPLRNTPWRISSFSEYLKYFGGAPKAEFEIRDARAGETVAFAQGGRACALDQIEGRYLLYYAMQLFFQNGGGPCYIVSVDGYQNAIDRDVLIGGIEALVKALEPTIVVVPDCILLTDLSSCTTVQKAMLRHCGETMRNRVAILDIRGGDKPRDDPAGDCVENFRGAIGTDHLSYAAAYYPWLHTTIVADRDLGYENIAKAAAALIPLLDAELASLAQSDNWNAAQIKQHRDAFGGITKDWKAAALTEPVPKLAEDKKSEWIENKRTLVNKTLDVISPLFRSIRSAMKDRLSLLPPSAAMAGIYTMVDNTRGVWKAPANVSVSVVKAPAVEISREAQEDLNVTAQGKSINAIRSFAGEGVLVWGARTLDGNSLDWRYISVRRTMIMIEE